MHLLYLDDSGSVKNAEDECIILAGLCIYETTPYHITQQFNTWAEELWPDNPSSLEFHGNEMQGGRKQWRGVANRRDMLDRALRFIGQSKHITLFGAVVDKRYASPKDAMEYAFEQLCSRFDQYLRRLYLQKNRHEKGLIIFDKSSYETSIQTLAREFSTKGHSWGQTRNIIEVPLFVDSKATRLIQCADLVAYALRRYYVQGEPQLFNHIAHKFDAEGGTLHGLVHALKAGNCDCISCLNSEKRKMFAHKGYK